MFYLYVKTHRKTGLKYLGKTVQDPHTYMGSGKRWLLHLAKHGYEVDTEIIGEFQTNEELREVAIQLSEEWNVAANPAWANIRPESGDGGDTSAFIDYSTLNRNKGKTYEEIHGSEKASTLKKARSESLRRNRQGKSWDEIFGVEKAAEMRKQKSETMRARKRQPMSAEARANIAAAKKGKTYTKMTCDLCGKEVSTNNFKKHTQSHAPLGMLEQSPQQ